MYYSGDTSMQDSKIELNSRSTFELMARLRLRLGPGCLIVLVLTKNVEKQLLSRKPLVITIT